jgi:hypothetical protein
MGSAGLVDDPEQVTGSIPVRSTNQTNNLADSQRKRDTLSIRCAPAFPERRIRSDRRCDQTLFLQSRKRGLQASLTRTHYSAGRVAALLNMAPPTLSVTQKRHLDAFMRFYPGVHKLRRFVFQFRDMLRWRSAKRLNTWIGSATVSGFRFTAEFARTLRRDLEVLPHSRR